MSEQKRFGRQRYFFGLALLILLGLVEIIGSATGSASATPSRSGAAGRLMAPAASSTPTCVPSWSVVSTPNVASLTSVAVISADDVWAVGPYPYFGGGSATLTMHWNGTTWDVVPSPNVGSSNALSGVAAVSSNDVWAVGTSYVNFPVETLALHWDGTAWSVVPSPVGGINGTEFTAVAAIASNDVWAVGSISDQYQHTLIAHWDGTQWNVVPNGNTLQRLNYLNSISVVSANDIWAAGLYDAAPSGPSIIQTFIEHWDGTAWSVVPSPNVGTGENRLYGIAAISSNDAWAVGYSCPSNPCGGGNSTLTEHWNGTNWTIVPSPNGGSPGNFLYGVAAVTTNNIWAVGDYPDAGGIAQTLTMNWDGSAWNIVDSPNVGSNGDRLNGVGAVGQQDIVAVGSYANNSTLVERYACPGPPPPTSTVTSTPTPSSTWTPTITGTPPTSTYTRTPTVTRTATSTITGTPPTATNTATVTRTPIYATPTTSCCYPSGIVTTTCTLADTYHYDVALTNAVPGCVLTLSGPVTIFFQVSTSPNGPWTLRDHHDVGTVNIPPGQWVHIVGDFYEPVIPTPNDYYRVGWGMYYINCQGSRYSDGYGNGAPTCPPGTSTPTQVLTGTPPTSTPTPLPACTVATSTPYPTPTDFPTVTPCPWCGPCPVLPTNTPYPTSTAYPCPLCPTLTPTTTRTSTRTSTSIPTVTPTPTFSGSCELQTVTPNPTYTPRPSPTNVAPPPTHTPCPSPPTYEPNATYTPNPTYTPVSQGTVTGTPPTNTATIAATAATATSTSPTATNTALSGTPAPTICPLQFSDVDTNNPFYTYIRCLACRGIVSGYADGTFRPNNNVTRGQLSKIVANSAGFNDPQTTQMFQDVPAGSTFFDYIGRLASREYINGYSCGGPTEPCVPPDNLPYFRTNNNATRGQITKIVSNAANFIDPPVGQIFEDVPPGSTFYTYTQRLATRSIMQGYACGSPGELCVPPTNRPYFRPNNNATRGQTSKIVANTFFSNCQTPSGRR